MITHHTSCWNSGRGLRKGGENEVENLNKMGAGRIEPRPFCLTAAGRIMLAGRSRFSISSIIISLTGL